MLNVCLYMYNFIIILFVHCIQYYLYRYTGLNWFKLTTMTCINVTIFRAHHVMSHRLFIIKHCQIMYFHVVYRLILYTYNIFWQYIANFYVYSHAQIKLYADRGRLDSYQHSSLSLSS